MKELYLTAIVAIFSGLSALAQTTDSPEGVKQYTAAIEWRTYNVEDVDLSVAMPKLPVKNQIAFSCDEKTLTTFHAYAKDVIYEFRYYTRTDVTENCLGKKSFAMAQTLRLHELRTAFNPPPVSEVDGTVNGRPVKIFQWKTPNDQAMRWVFLDGTANQWMEVAINSRLDAVPETERFLKSLGKQLTSGVKIQSGSRSTLGDDISSTDRTDAVAVNPTSIQTKTPLALVSKPQAKFTPEAVSNWVEGSVLLKVTLLANGGIGDITVGRGLPHGLTEQAIEAARRIVFLPARVDGKAVSSIRTFDYTFTIY